MRILIGVLLLGMSLAVLWWSNPFEGAIETLQSRAPQSLLEPAVAQDLEKMKSENLLPQLKSGLGQIEVEVSNTADPLLQRVGRSYQNAFKSRSGGKSILKIFLLHQDNNVVVLMSLEDMKSKNRFWELGRTLSFEDNKSVHK